MDEFRKDWPDFIRVASAVSTASIEDEMVLHIAEKIAHDPDLNQMANSVAQASIEKVAILADELAWKHDLRGYDSVHLASAIIWRDGLQAPVIFSTFDKELWKAARKEKFRLHPINLDKALKKSR